MNFIRKIEIRHFRSIYELDIDNLSHINVFSGLNDVGKSNVVKALNLFFNDQVDWDTPLWFTDDINSFHAHRAKFGKIQREIRVKMHFNRPKRRYVSSLPEQFWIERVWEFFGPDFGWTTWGEEGSAVVNVHRPRAITEILNRSHFFYVPAVRGRDYYQHLIGRLAAAIANQADGSMAAASDQLSNAIESKTLDLVQILHSVTGLDFELRLPRNMQVILRSASFNTEGNVPLEMRGDGIQGMIVPGILSYLSKKKGSDYYFWGFEEPENSLELSRVMQLTENLQKDYSHLAQIFLTTHSPAIVVSENERTSVFRVFQKVDEYPLTGHAEKTTEIQYVSGDNKSLLEELGLPELVRDFVDDYQERINVLERKVEAHESESNLSRRPRLIVEGKLDLDTLEHAWQRLNFDAMPFEIKAAGDANEVIDQVAVWPELRESRVCALVDHDDAGGQAIKKLDKYRSRGFVKDPYPSHIQYRCGEQVLAISLPCPNGRKENAQNWNLPLEFYFSDSVLEDLNESLDTAIFSDKFRIIDGKSKKETKRALELLMEGGEVTMAHRKIEGPGKARLVESLQHLSDEDFENFRSLFEIITSHLVSGC